MSGILTILGLLLAHGLIYDGIAGVFEWHGLRSTPLPTWLALLAGCGALIGLGVTSIWVYSSVLIWILAAVLALPLHMLIAVVLQRQLAPQAWTTPGHWARHQVQAIELTTDDQPIPAFLFEPNDPSHGAVVLLHGAGAHKTYYNWPLIDGLLAAGLAVCTVDLDGRGTNPRILDFPAVLEDANAAVGWLRGRMAWVGLVGISLGGCVAARAVAEGLQVDALAILESPDQLKLTRQVYRHEQRTLLRAATWGLHRYAGTIQLIRSWATTQTRTRIGTVELIQALDLRGSLARVTCPLWLCYGGNDGVVPPSELPHIQQAAPPDTPFVVVPRATHLSLPIDRRAVNALRQWLQPLAACSVAQEESARKI